MLFWRFSLTIMVIKMIQVVVVMGQEKRWGKMGEKKGKGGNLITII